MGHTIRLFIAVIAVLSFHVFAGGPKSPVEGLSNAEWAQITRQIDAPKYRAHESDAGYDAYNPAQGWKIQYQADGQTRIVPGNPNTRPYHIALKLAAVGYGETFAEFTSPESLVAGGGSNTAGTPRCMRNGSTVLPA